VQDTRQRPAPAASVSSRDGEATESIADYDGFVSYSHAVDGRLAPALQAGLHRFARPLFRVRALRIFRDETSLSATPELWPSIVAALDRSRWLILLASPESAKSTWVNDEVAHWCAKEANKKRILVVVTKDDQGGEFDWDATTSVPPTLRRALSTEPRVVDLRWARDEADISLQNARFRDAVADVAAPLHGRPKDELHGEDVRQHRRAKRLARTAVAALAALALGAATAAFLAVRAANEAERQRDQAVSRELAARANAMLPFDPAASRRLAERAESRKETREAVAALQEAVIADRLLVATQAGGKPPNPTDVGAVVYTPDGRWLITGGDDGRIRLWDAATAEPRREAQTDQEVRSVAVDRAGRRLVVGTTATVQLWDLPCLIAMGGTSCRAGPGDREALVRTGMNTTAVADGSANRVVTFADDETTATIWQRGLRPGPTLHFLSPVTAVAISDDGGRVATGTRAGRVVIWATNGRRLAAGPRHRQRVSALGFGPGGVLVSGSDDGTVRLWEPGALPANRLIGELPGQVQRMAVSRTGYVAAGGESGVVYAWELATGRFVGALAGHTGIVSALRYGRDGRRLFSASDEGTLRAWESATGGSRAAMAGHRSRVQDIAISPRGDRAASVGSDGELRIWDVARDTSTVELVGHTRAIPSLVYSRDGSRIVTASLDGTARVWDAISGREVRRIRARARLQAAVFGPGGSIIVADWNGIASRWDPGKDEPTWRAPACGQESCGKAYTLAVAADGRFVAAGSDHGAVLLDAATGKRIRALHGDAFIVSLQFDAVGAHVLSAGVDGRAVLAPTRRTGDAVTLTQQVGALREARLAPDGQTALIAGDNGACLWTAGIAPRCAWLSVPTDEHILYSGDARTGPFRIVVAGASGTVFSFASRDGQPLRLAGQTGAIERVRLTADGRRVVSIGQDGVARVWDARSGARVARFTGATTGLLDIAFDPNSRRMAVASNDGTARIYRWR
jgi:WD40 repeat protein